MFGAERAALACYRGYNTLPRDSDADADAGADGARGPERDALGGSDEPIRPHVRHECQRSKRMVQTLLETHRDLDMASVLALLDRLRVKKALDNLQVGATLSGEPILFGDTNDGWIDALMIGTHEHLRIDELQAGHYKQGKKSKDKHRHRHRHRHRQQNQAAGSSGAAAEKGGGVVDVDARQREKARLLEEEGLEEYNQYFLNDDDDMWPIDAYSEHWDLKTPWFDKLVRDYALNGAQARVLRDFVGEVLADESLVLEDMVSACRRHFATGIEHIKEELINMTNMKLADSVIPMLTMWSSLPAGYRGKIWCMKNRLIDYQLTKAQVARLEPRLRMYAGALSEEDMLEVNRKRLPVLDKLAGELVDQIAAVSSAGQIAFIAAYMDGYRRQAQTTAINVTEAATLHKAVPGFHERLDDHLSTLDRHRALVMEQRKLKTLDVFGPLLLESFIDENALEKAGKSQPIVPRRKNAFRAAFLRMAEEWLDEKTALKLDKLTTLPDSVTVKALRAPMLQNRETLDAFMDRADGKLPEPGDPDYTPLADKCELTEVTLGPDGVDPTLKTFKKKLMDSLGLAKTDADEVLREIERSGFDPKKTLKVFRDVETEYLSQRPGDVEGLKHHRELAKQLEFTPDQMRLLFALWHVNCETGELEPGGSPWIQQLKSRQDRNLHFFYEFMARFSQCFGLVRPGALVSSWLRYQREHPRGLDDNSDHDYTATEQENGWDDAEDDDRHGFGVPAWASEDVPVEQADEDGCLGLYPEPDSKHLPHIPGVASQDEKAAKLRAALERKGMTVMQFELYRELARRLTWEEWKTLMINFRRIRESRWAKAVSEGRLDPHRSQPPAVLAATLRRCPDLIPWLGREISGMLAQDMVQARVADRINGRHEYMCVRRHTYDRDAALQMYGEFMGPEMKHVYENVRTGADVSDSVLKGVNWQRASGADVAKYGINNVDELCEDVPEQELKEALKLASKINIVMERFEVMPDVFTAGDFLRTIPTRRKVFVGNLTPMTTPIDLHDVFARFGTIEGVELFKNRHLLNHHRALILTDNKRVRMQRFDESDKRESPVHGFVYFETHEGAKAALERPIELLGVLVGDRMAYTSRADSLKRVRIYNVQRDADLKELTHYLHKAFGFFIEGHGRLFRLTPDSKETTARNYVTAVFNSHEDADIAMRLLNTRAVMHGKELQGVFDMAARQDFRVEPTDELMKE